MKVVALLLAAGSSSRSGKINKLLFKYKGRALVLHSASALLQSNIEEIVVVLGDNATTVKKEFEQEFPNARVNYVLNKQYLTGMSSSLQAGLNQVQDADAILVALGDMPHIESTTINELIFQFERTSDKSIFIPVYEARRGHPVLLGATMFEHLMALEGDVGARALIAQMVEEVEEVPVACQGILDDYDTVDALKKLTQ